MRPSLVFLILSSVLAGLSTSRGYSADLTLTKADLDARNGFIDFKQYPHTLAPGDRVLLEGHTRPSLFLVNLVYGTAASPITVTNTGAAPFVIDAVGPTANDGIQVWGAQHVVLKGTPVGTEQYGIKVLKAVSVCLDVEYNNYQQDRIAGEFENTTDLEISHVELSNCGFAGIQAKYESTGITFPPGALLDGLEIHHTLIHDTEGEGMYIGWTSDGHPDVANVSVHDNVVRQAGWDGIQLNRSQGTNAVFNNVVDGYAVKAVNANGTTNAAQNEGITASGSKIHIYGNTVKASNRNSGSALFFVIYDVTNVYNNVFVHGGGFGGTQHDPAMYIKQDAASPRLAALPSAKLNLVNNTVVKPDFHGIELLGGVTRPVDIVNTVIAQPLNGGTYVNVQNPQNPPVQTANLYYATVAEAGFVSATDYHPAEGSPLIDAGTNASIYGVTTDRDGVSRPQGAGYDVGAYEKAQDPETILTPTPGTAAGSQFCPATGAFNAQPTWNGTSPQGLDPVEHSGTDTAYANRHWYVDFGADWAKVRIKSLWTRYRPFSGGSYTGFPTLWWDDDSDNVNDGTSAADLNFITAQGLPHVGTQQWVRDRELTAAVTPGGRYLVVATGPAPTDRANELAFVGYRVP